MRRVDSLAESHTAIPWQFNADRTAANLPVPELGGNAGGRHRRRRPPVGELVPDMPATRLRLHYDDDS